jgi:hypothetical protein
MLISNVVWRIYNWGCYIWGGVPGMMLPAVPNFIALQTDGREGKVSFPPIPETLLLL